MGRDVAGYCLWVREILRYPVVIIPLTMQFFVMLPRNLLYTGITRAKRVVILIGSKKAIGCAVRNADVIKRNTGLAKRLTETFDD